MIDAAVLESDVDLGRRRAMRHGSREHVQHMRAVHERRRDPDRTLAPSTALHGLVADLARYARVPLVEVLGRCRHPHVHAVRVAIIGCARELTTASLPTIGRALGRRHSTVAWALGRWAQLPDEQRLLWLAAARNSLSAAAVDAALAGLLGTYPRLAQRAAAGAAAPAVAGGAS